jgi:membrane associated rhomboid family serine protease
MSSIPIATILLIATIGYVTFRGATRPEFMEKYIFSTQAILGRHEYLRLLSSGFLHANWLHVGFNIFTIYSFGSSLELSYGARVVLVVFFASVLGGNALSLYLHRNHDYFALGASGGACGILFAHMFLLPGGSVSSILVPIHIPAWLYAIMFLVGSYYGLRAQADNIGHDAHLGGALIGLAVTTFMYPRLILAQPVLFGAVLVIAGWILYFLWKHPLYHVRARPAPKPGPHPPASVTPLEQLQVDVLLDKISRDGPQSLSESERRFLMQVSKRKRDGQNPA